MYTEYNPCLERCLASFSSSTSSSPSLGSAVRLFLFLSTSYYILVCRCISKLCIHYRHSLWSFPLTCRLTSVCKGLLSCPPSSVTTPVTCISCYVSFATCSRTTLCQRSGCPPRRLVFLIADPFQHAPRRYSLAGRCQLYDT